jgi:hypothetical protein
VCSSVDRLVRTPSITAGTKEKQQIRVRTKFGVERGRTWVGDRTRVGEFLFVSIALVALNRPWHLVFIGWRGLALVGLIKYIFGSLNWIISVWTSLTDRLNWSDQCKSVQKSGNFQISQLSHPESDLDK